MDVTERKRAEEERRAHLWFLESMDRVNRAMQRTNDVEGMMSGVLEETLAIFGSDRAWLVYPCDPDAATSRVVMEHTRPEYPGAFALGEEFPVDTQAAEILRRVLDGPGAATDLSVPPADPRAVQHPIDDRDCGSSQGRPAVPVRAAPVLACAGLDRRGAPALRGDRPAPGRRADERARAPQPAREPGGAARSERTSPKHRK